MPTPSGYSRPQIALHWVVAILIAGQFLFHDGISEAWHALRDGAASVYTPLALVHIAVGVVILALIIWRLSLRLKRGAPPPPENEHPLLKTAAHVTHRSFYALLVVLPVSGLVAWFGGVGAAAEAHEVLSNGLLALVGLHVLAALFHQFFLKTEVLRRMVRPAI